MKTILVLLWLVMFVGWGMNLYKFVDSDFEPVGKAEVIRAVSIFIFPVGGVIGYMDIGKENER